MIYLHKILPLLISPLMLVFALLLLGAWRRCRVSIVAALLVLWLASTPLLAQSLFRFIEGHAVRQEVSTQPQTDAIVVLSGMLSDVPAVNGIATEWSDPDRFFAGLELYEAGKAPVLVFTAGRMPWTLSAQSEGAQLRDKALSMGIPATAMKLTAEVENTADEAQEVSKLLGPTQRKVLLITSAFHMPRAQRLFERVGFTVQAFPVDFKIEVAAFTPMDVLPNTRALMLTDIALRELLGRLYYWLRG